MKSLILLLCLASPLKASYPDVITDPALNEVLIYIDGKVSTALTNITALGATIGSTVTILGVTNGGTGAATIAGAQANLQVPSTTGGGASGTWSININGNATTANSASTANTATSVPTSGVDLSTVTSALALKLNLTGGNLSGQLSTSSSMTAVGNIQAAMFVGDGSLLTNTPTNAFVGTDMLPVGTFIQYGSTVAPRTFLYCDGTNYSTTTYSQLFSVIGYSYGGSGANFTCDFRGMFARGLDTTGTIDSEVRVIGSSETDKFQGFKTNTGNLGCNNTAGAGSNLWAGNDSGTGSAIGLIVTDGVNGTPRTGNETRPKNIAVAVMVKYTMFGSTSSINLLDSTNTWTAPQTVNIVGSVTGNVTGNATTATSVPASGVDLSTVTTALTGKLTSPATFYIVRTSDYLTNPATFTILTGPYLTSPATFYIVPTSAYLTNPSTFTIFTNSDVIRSSATGSYLLRVATATYLATAPGACGAGEFISGLTADGTKTCAAPAGGGDVVLASTQTFTGANTFTSSVTLTQPIIQSAWIAPTLLNSWVNYGGSYEIAGYYLDKEGIVHLRGFIKSGTSINATMFVLPVGYRPAYTTMFSTVSADAFAYFSIDTSGNINGAVGSTTWFSLANISFRSSSY